MNLFKRNIKNDIIPNYEKLAENLYINYTEKKIIINNYKLNFSNILDVKLVENGFEKIMGSNVNSNFMIGHSKVLINQLDIEIKTNDMNNPFFNIPFLKLGIHLGFHKTSKKYKEAYHQAQHCLSTLEIIVNNNRQI